jgi:glycosyltransferase involved in cell wall biosynthesis
VLVKPKNLDQIAEVMIALLRDPDRRQQLSQDGLVQAAKFDWKQTAAQTLQVYQTTARGRV